jgi:hypothetical protein
MSVQPIEMRKFRRFVDEIQNKRNSAIIKAYYLTASRVSELCTKCVPSELLNKKSKPYGCLLNFGFQDFQVTPELKEKVFLITEAVAKRSKTKKGDKTSQATEQQVEEALKKFGLTKLLEQHQQGKEISSDVIAWLSKKMVFKMIALPVNPKYEPWTKDLLLFIQRQKGKLSLDLTRHRLWEIVKHELSPLDRKVRTHTLRHWRISHLIENFNFSPYEVTVYAGWTIGSTFGAMGIQASRNIDIYAHLTWRTYFPKMLVPYTKDNDRGNQD